MNYMLYDLYRVLAWRAWENGQQALCDDYIAIAEALITEGACP